MFARKAVGCHINLSLDDEPDESKELIEFYEQNLPQLKRCSLNYVPSHIIRAIAVYIDTTALFPGEWRKYATDMGIADNYILNEIEIAATSLRDQPIFIVMHHYLRQRCVSFGLIIDVLLRENRLDALKKIEPFVRKLLESNAQTEMKTIESSQDQRFCNLPQIKELAIPLPSHKELNSRPLFLSTNLKNSNSCTKTIEQCSTVEKHPASPDEPKKCELNPLQQSSVNTHSSGALRVPNTTKVTDTSSERHAEEHKQIPSAPSEDKLSVLIQHTESESGIAEQLCRRLTQEGMVVTTLADVNDLTPFDATNALHTMFQQVDFIIPVVSENLMQEIYPQNYDLYLESTYAVNNRNLFQLIMNEYRNNRCVNFRVRPVILPEMSRRLLVRDVILSFSFRLWSEVPKLVRVLKETKVLNAQQMVR